MKRIITIACLMVWTFVYGAQHIDARYDVKFSLLGKVGDIDVKMDKNDKDYIIRFDLRTTGAIKQLSGNRKEKHRSYGHIEDNRLISDRYEIERTYKNKKTIKRYRFDHINKRIYLTKIKFKNGKRVYKKNKVLPYYTADDLLTLYFNLEHYTQGHKPGKYRFKSAGAEKKGGVIDIRIPNRKRQKRYRKEMGTKASWYATAIIHQKIFSNKEGKVDLAIGKDGLANKILIKDAMLYGDATAVRVK